MNILVSNLKGGSGKSTAASQLCCPFIFEKINRQKVKVNLLEVDSCNHDAASYSNAKSIQIEQYDYLNEDEFETVKKLSRIKNTVVDLGGNISSERIINLIENHPAILKNFAAFVIPFGDGEQDIINAITIYEKIKSISSKIKFIFVLTKVHNIRNYQYQFFNFFGDVKQRFNGQKGLIDYVLFEDQNIFPCPYTDIIKLCRFYGVSVYDFYQLGSDFFDEKYNQAIAENADEATIDKEYFKCYMHSVSIDYFNSHIKAFFQLASKTLRV